MTYTTQQLIEILDRELKANWKGERIVLSSAERINDPVVAKLFNLDRLSKVFAYQDFRGQIHQYQQEHQVSGIIWRNCTFKNKTVCYPEIHNQLIPLDKDKEILIQAKESVIAFWQEATLSMNFWLATAPGRDRSLGLADSSPETQEYKEAESILKEERVSISPTSPSKTTPHQKINREYVSKLIRQAEWAEIDAAINEVYLGLCWGDPLEYRYQWAKPKSGCDRIIAADIEPSSIKI